MQRAKIGFLVQTRAIRDKDDFGNRYYRGKARKGSTVTLNVSTNKIEKISAAIKTAIKKARQRLEAYHIGTLIYIRSTVNLVPSKTVVPIFEAKWGHDNLPYIAWKQNPVAEYWRRQVGIGKPAKPRKPQTSVLRPYAYGGQNV